MHRVVSSSLFALALVSPLAAQTMSSAGSTDVGAVQATRVTDLVLLRAGFNAGLRQGMVCQVTRGDELIADVLVVDLRPTCATALILGGQQIQLGDRVTVKTVKV